MARQMVATAAGLPEFGGTAPGRSSDTDGSPFSIHYLADYPHAGRQLAAWLHQGRPDTYAPEGALAFIEGFANRDRLPLALFACNADLSPLGMVSLIRSETPLSEPTALLLALYVAPAHRNRGIATELCRRAGAEAQQLGWPAVAAYTTDSQAFYQRIGWRTVMQAIITSRPGNRPVWFMENALSSPAQ
jgi:GNAT superfamily N-acetyltransferase